MPSLMLDLHLHAWLDATDPFHSLPFLLGIIIVIVLFCSWFPSSLSSFVVWCTWITFHFLLFHTKGQKWIGRRERENDKFCRSFNLLQWSLPWIVSSSGRIRRTTSIFPSFRYPLEGTVIPYETRCPANRGGRISPTAKSVMLVKIHSPPEASVIRSCLSSLLWVLYFSCICVFDFPSFLVARESLLVSYIGIHDLVAWNHGPGTISSLSEAAGECVVIQKKGYT